jgi:ATP-dependent Clp protease ATP-binding subunit ClpC
VDTEHLLLGVIDEGGNLALRVLDSLDIEVADLRAELVASMGAGAPAGRDEGTRPFTPGATRVLEATVAEAARLFHNYVGCEHLLLGLLATEEATASQVLRRMGLELRTTRRAVATALAGVVHAQGGGAPPRADDLGEIRRRLDAIERRLGG